MNDAFKNPYTCPHCGETWENALFSSSVVHTWRECAAALRRDRDRERTANNEERAEWSKAMEMLTGTSTSYAVTEIVPAIARVMRALPGAAIAGVEDKRTSIYEDEWFHVWCEKGGTGFTHAPDWPTTRTEADAMALTLNEGAAERQSGWVYSVRSVRDVLASLSTKSGKPPAEARSLPGARRRSR